MTHGWIALVTVASAKGPFHPKNSAMAQSFLFHELPFGLEAVGTYISFNDLAQGNLKMSESTDTSTPRPQPPEDLHWGIAYLREDIQDIRNEIRGVNSRADGFHQSLNERIDESNRSVNERIDELNNSLTKRIDESNRSLVQRIDESNRSVNGRIDELNRSLGERIDKSNQSVNGRIDELNRSLTERIDEKHELLAKRLDSRIALMMTLMVALIGVVVAVIKI